VQFVVYVAPTVWDVGAVAAPGGAQFFFKRQQHPFAAGCIRRQAQRSNALDHVNDDVGQGGRGFDGHDHAAFPSSSDLTE